jgi:hypothetical protein
MARTLRAPTDNAADDHALADARWVRDLYRAVSR